MCSIAERLVIAIVGGIVGGGIVLAVGSLDSDEGPAPSLETEAAFVASPTPTRVPDATGSAPEQLAFVSAALRQFNPVPPYSCPRTASVEADITVDGTGSLNYYWKIWYPAADVVVETQEEILSFDQAGTKTVTSDWEFTRETAEKIGGNIPPVFLVIISPIERQFQISVEGFCG